MSKSQMSRSWLVQRLQQPVRGPNPFSFGGGLVRGGLSAEAMDLIGGIWSFDYMGAAEYEWGAVPEALNRIAKAAGDLLAFDVETDHGVVHAIGRNNQAEEIARRVTGWAAEPYPRGKHETRDPVLLHRALTEDQDERFAVVGWLELDNGFLFFTDEAMFRSAAELFGVTVASPA